jgi:hypothetical protein
MTVIRIKISERVRQVADVVGAQLRFREAAWTAMEISWEAGFTN